jgi:hypothetical protein
MSTTSSKVFSKRVHVFTAGPQVSAQGVERNFTPQDLQQVVDSYDPQTHEAPLVIGHTGDNDSVPSFGWVKKLVRSGEKLYADVDFTDTAKDLVKKGHYRKVSISFYSPNSPINPHEGQWSVRHLALLGASPPAVKGLEPFSFSEEGNGVFNFASALSPEDIFDDELGPTLLVERSPLEILKEKLEEIRGDMSSSLQELQENQDDQTETDVDSTQTTNSADESTAPENPNQQFSEMKKKMGREGAEVSESAQSLANMEDKFPEEKFDEGVSRKVAKGAHGHHVQVVEEVFEEGDEELSDEHREIPAAFKKNIAKMKAKHKAHDEDGEDDEDELSEEHGEVPAAFKKNIAKMKAKTAKVEESDEEDSEGDYAEVGFKKTANRQASFGKRAEKDPGDPAGRSKTARSSDDSYGDRQSVGQGGEEDREGLTSDVAQDTDRLNTAKDGDQEQDREELAKALDGEGDEDSRWADQPEGRRRSMEDDQYNDGEYGLPGRNKPGTSDGNDPHGRDGGPTSVSEDSEEEPDTEDIAVPLQSTKGNKVSRVLHQTSGQKRASVKGKEIADHSEESDGVTRTAKKAGVSAGNDPHGREDGPTNFPDRSEEEPDDLDIAVDLESVVGSRKVRVLRQRSGEKPSIDHAEEDDLDMEECGTSRKVSRKFAERDPMTRTGKGSTYGQKRPVMEEDDDEEMYDEDDDFSETEDFCGMGSMGQAKPMGYPVQMFEEFQRELENLKNENSRLRKEYQEHQTNSRKQRIADFVDSLYTEGKMTDGVIPQRDLQNYCEGLEFGTLDFAEGETPTTKLFALLERLPNMVHFGEVVAEGRFSDPEDDEDLDPHSRAMKMVQAGECDYVEAIKRSIPWGGRG